MKKLRVLRRVAIRVIAPAILLFAALGLPSVAQGPRPLPPPPADREKAHVAGPAWNGLEVMVDLPPSQHVKNFGAPNPPHSGLCVFASMDMAARWHNLRPLIGIINKIADGGGWPEKVEKVIKQYAPGVDFVQYEGTDLSGLDAALASGKAACVTYGYSERYTERGEMVTILHMVLLVYLDGEHACILDNNFVAETGRSIDVFEWMSREEFARRFAHPQGAGWYFFFLAPPPPPVPHN